MSIDTKTDGRVIKLRAWDGERMITESVRDEYDDYYTLDLDGTFYGHTRTGDEWFNYDQDETNKKKFILMQYIGTNDVDGKEIYEGDIVLGYSNHFKKYQNKEVIWDNSGWELSPKLGISFATKIKVVGNIYETPSLLNLNTT